MNGTRDVTAVAIFSSLVISTDWLIPIPNVKLLDTLVFATAYSFGFRVGALIGIVSELVWGIINPLGFGGPIIPFTVGGVLIYSVIGYWTSRVWGANVSPLSMNNVYFGALIAIGAFVFDLETNLATAFLVHWPPSAVVVGITLLMGVPFAITHEVADFALGATLAPLLIHFFATRVGSKRSSAQLETGTLPSMAERKGD